MTKSEIHRMLKNPIYTGDFLWVGIRRKGSHKRLVSHDLFERVQDVLKGGKPHGRYRKQQHPFMGLLTCARCGCAMTAERKKAKYVYYRCTGFKGACGNAYIREERLAELLVSVVTPIQITAEIADDIAAALRASDTTAAECRTAMLTQLEQRRRVVLSKLDRGYEDLMSERISNEFWSRKSQEWETDLQTVEREIARVAQARPLSSTGAEKILELAKNAEFLYKQQNPREQRRLLETVLSNCTFNRGSLCPTYTSPFDLLVRGNETGDWRRGWDSNPRAGYPTTRFRGAPVTTTSVPLRW